MIDLKGDKSDSTINSYKNLYKALERFCKANGYNFMMDLNRINLQFLDKYRVWLVNENDYAGDTAHKYFSLFGSTLKKAKGYGRIFNNTRIPWSCRLKDGFDRLFRWAAGKD